MSLMRRTDGGMKTRVGWWQHSHHHPACFLGFDPRRAARLGGGRGRDQEEERDLTRGHLGDRSLLFLVFAELWGRNN